MPANCSTKLLQRIQSYGPLSSQLTPNSVALKLFSLMSRQSNPLQKPNHFTFSTIVTIVAGSPEYIQCGETVHAHVRKSGFIPNSIILETGLVDIYSKCGFMKCAYKLFDEMPQKNLVIWNALIAVRVHNEMEIDGLRLFCMMKKHDLVLPDEVNVEMVLLGCGQARDLVVGMQVHGYSSISGLERRCANLIGNMYFHCGEVKCAERVLAGAEGDAISRLIKIRGYTIQ